MKSFNTEYDQTLKKRIVLIPIIQSHCQFSYFIPGCAGVLVGHPFDTVKV